MKIMIRKSHEGILSIYVPKKDLEEPIVSMEKPEMWAASSRSAMLAARIATGSTGHRNPLYGGSPPSE